MREKSLTRVWSKRLFKEFFDLLERERGERNLREIGKEKQRRERKEKVKDFLSFFFF